MANLLRKETVTNKTRNKIALNRLKSNSRMPQTLKDKGRFAESKGALGFLIADF